MMSDHQDSEHFMGVRSEDEILRMLDHAERRKNYHLTLMQKYTHYSQKSNRMYHARNYKALEGVVKTLRWALGDMNVEHPLE